MKVCPSCGEVYGSESSVCRAHGTALRDWSEASEFHTDVHTDVDIVPAPEIEFAAQVVGEINVESGEYERLSTSVHSGSQPRVQVRAPTGRVEPKGGRVLGDRYRLDKHIGVGGYGAVFAAHDMHTGTRVAVKVLSPAASQSHEMLTRFHREAIAASRVQHRHIVDVLDFDVADDGTYFIVMEYLDGRDLSEALQDGATLDPAAALAIVAQCAGGLSAAHEAGILHRDLKPANVFLVKREGRPDFVKIIDFGISKLTRKAGNYSDITGASKVVGTPCYMSPEQAKGKESDGRCDVYGLGVILFEMLTGEKPFTGRSTLDILTKHIEAPRVAPSSIRPELARYEGLDELVVTALAAKPSRRFASMAAFGVAVLTLLRAIDPRRADEIVLGTGNITGVMARARAGKPSAEITLGVGHRPARRRGLLMAGGLAVAVAAVMLWFVTRDRGADQPSKQRPAIAASGAPGTQTESRVAVVVPAKGSGTPSARSRPARAGASPENVPSSTAPSQRRRAASKPVRAARSPVRRTPRPQAALPDHSVRVTSSPAGAIVYRGRDRLGRTPVTVVVEAGTSAQRISVRAPGRLPRRVTLKRSRDAVHVHLRARARKSGRSSKGGLGIAEW